LTALSESLTPLQATIMRQHLHGLIKLANIGRGVNIAAWMRAVRVNEAGTTHIFNAEYTSHVTNCLYCGKQITGTKKLKYCRGNGNCRAQHMHKMRMEARG
jgi:hypothetical protein